MKTMYARDKRRRLAVLADAAAEASFAGATSSEVVKASLHGVKGAKMADARYATSRRKSARRSRRASSKGRRSRR